MVTVKGGGFDGFDIEKYELSLNKEENFAQPLPPSGLTQMPNLKSHHVASLGIGKH